MICPLPPFPFLPAFSLTHSCSADKIAKDGKKENDFFPKGKTMIFFRLFCLLGTVATIQYGQQQQQQHSHPSAQVIIPLFLVSFFFFASLSFFASGKQQTHWIMRYMVCGKTGEKCTRAVMTLPFRFTLFLVLVFLFLLLILNQDTGFFSGQCTNFFERGDFLHF